LPDAPSKAEEGDWAGHRTKEALTMILLTTQVDDFDQFLEIYSTKGLEKRKAHGSKGSTVFRDPNDESRVWAIFDWDPEGFKSFVADPEVPPILEEAGHKGTPEFAELSGSYNG
jgi:hypothetical protein